MIDEGKKQAAELARQFWKLWGSADLRCTAGQPPRLAENLRRRPSAVAPVWTRGRPWTPAFREG